MIGCKSLFPKITTPPKSLPSGLTLVNTPPAEKYPEDSAIILYESIEGDVDYLVGVGLKQYKTVHRVWKVFKNIELFADIFDAFPEDAIIESFYARTITPDGREIILNKSDFFVEKSERISTDYQNAHKEIRFLLPSIEKGSIIEYHYTIVTDGGNSGVMWWIQSYYPKLETHLHVRLPKWIIDEKSYGWSWQHKIYNYKGVISEKPVDEFGDSGDRIFHWHATNVPAYRSELLEGEETRNRGYMRLKVGGYSNWKKMSYKFYDYNIKELLEPNETIRKKALELTKDAKTEEEKIKAIYYFVRRFSYDKYQNRYGHGHLPNEPETILERGYGDCKDQAILIVALLRELDIDAFAALIGAGDDSDIDEDFQIDYFNHLIAYVKTKDGKDIWLDPTFSTCPYGVVSSFCDDRISVIAAEKGTLKPVVKRTPKVTPAVTGKEVYKLNITVAPDKTVATSVQINAFGEEAGRRMWAFQLITEDKEIKQYCRQEISPNYFNGKLAINGAITDSKHNNPEQKEDNYEFSFNAKLDLLKEQNGLYYLDFFPLNQEYADGAGFIEDNNKEGKKREHNLHWPSLFRKEIEITINYPEDMKVKTLPENKKLKLTDNATFSLTMNKESQGIIKATVIFSLHKKVLLKEDYEKVKTFYTEMAKALAENLVFESISSQPAPSETEQETPETATEGASL